MKYLPAPNPERWIDKEGEEDKFDELAYTLGCIFLNILESCDKSLYKCEECSKHKKT